MTAFTTGPLPQRLKIVHGFGAVAFGVKDSGFSFFLLIFYNQVLGMNAALVSAALACALLVDAGFLDQAVGLDLLRVDLLLGLDPCRIGFAGALGLGAGDFGGLGGAAHFNLALLLQPGVFGIAADLEALLRGLQVLGLHLDARVLLDVVAQLLARLDLLGQLSETFGVEGVVGVEVFDRGLVEPGQRDRFPIFAERGLTFLPPER